MSSKQNSSMEYLGLAIFLSIIVGYCIAWLIFVTF